MGKNHIFMTDNRLNKKFPPLYVAENKKAQAGIEQWHIWLHKTQQQRYNHYTTKDYVYKVFSGIY